MEKKESEAKIARKSAAKAELASQKSKLHAEAWT